MISIIHNTNYIMVITYIYFKYNIQVNYNNDHGNYNKKLNKYDNIIRINMIIIIITMYF